MSKIKFLALSALLLVPMLSEASITNLGTVTTSASFASASSISGNFNDEYDFSTVGASAIGVSATNVEISVGYTIYGSISNFAGTLDGHSLTLTTTSLPAGPTIYIFQVLASGLDSAATLSHILHITGNGLGGSYGGAITVVPTAVPVPAAFLLMGSALVGLVGFGKRKESLIA